MVFKLMQPTAVLFPEVVRAHCIHIRRSSIACYSDAPTVLTVTGEEHLIVLDPNVKFPNVQFNLFDFLSNRM